MISREEILKYHESGRKGKIEVIATKPLNNSRDLSIAYTPGVAIPCLEIEKNSEDAYRYTAKGNLVAVVSNGSAVLGLGNIGALAGKPVMEGKGMLFKKLADIDVFDIEIDSSDPDEIIKVVKLIEPTFGGINLEDIKAPDCFYIESELKKIMNIPVFHDDQHGTAVISGAALLNALEIVGKRIEEIKMVVNGAGAAGIACAKYYNKLGIKKENIFMCDSKGLITKKRQDINGYKIEFAQDTNLSTLKEIIIGADFFFGVSVKDILSEEMIRSMNKNPVVFAMANPDPEISYEKALSIRNDIIMATGRSDSPNQVNNLLGFPYIFRGALDVRATEINEEMKIAATKALALLAHKDVPESIRNKYNESELKFGKDYIIPKPLDPRVLYYVTPEVAKAAIETGVARKIIDMDDYRFELKKKSEAGF
jgi:malate dehydrogenase (oxaloacetate-decarboxylating)(NADP+)